jgi:hypothetical protein
MNFQKGGLTPFQGTDERAPVHVLGLSPFSTHFQVSAAGVLPLMG